MPSELNLRSIHRLSMNHRKLVEASTECGCFYCLRTFTVDQVEEWVDDEQTARCPYCDIDAVLPQHPTYELSEELLAAMHEYWF